MIFNKITRKQSFHLYAQSVMFDNRQQQHKWRNWEKTRAIVSLAYPILYCNLCSRLRLGLEVRVNVKSDEFGLPDTTRHSRTPRRHTTSTGNSVTEILISIGCVRILFLNGDADSIRYQVTLFRCRVCIAKLIRCNNYSVSNQKYRVPTRISIGISLLSLSYLAELNANQDLGDYRTPSPSLSI